MFSLQATAAETAPRTGIRLRVPEGRNFPPVNYLTRTSHLYITDRIFGRSVPARRNEKGV